jgi:predicted phage-related endonuclease
MANIITPSLAPAKNDKTRAHLYELLAQRITQHVEPHYISDDMLRGHEDEIEARALYERHYGEVTQCGFVTNDKWGFTIGCSPDGLVGEDGLIEIKSRRHRFQVATIVSRQMPADYLMQVQTALLVTERDWCDFISYSGGLPMATIRVWPDERVQSAIIEAATTFEETLAAMLDSYAGTLASGLRLIPTERRIEQEMTI